LLWFLLSLAVVGGVILALVWTTIGLAKYKVEVCIDFQGRSSCRTASGSSEEFALRAATTNACALIASGVTDSMACERIPPKSITWLRRP